jgi:hypothetical protein
MCRLAITGNKDIKVPDENTHINDTEKGTSVEIAREGHVDCVLRYGTSCSF